MDRSLRREARVVFAEVSAVLDGSSTMVLISDCRVMSAGGGKKSKHAINMICPTAQKNQDLLVCSQCFMAQGFHAMNFTFDVSKLVTH